MAYQWSTEQLRAIDARGGNLLVSASAGSGKTTLMLERLTRLLLEGVGIGRMLVVTFASAQAADMLEKLKEKLAALAIELPGQRELIAAQLAELPYADISTLHSFCMQLVKRYFYIAQVPSNFALSSELDTLLRRNAACDAVISRLVVSGNEAFMKLYDYLCYKRGTRKLKAAVFKVAEYLETMPDTEAELHQLEHALKELTDDTIDCARKQLLGRLDQLSCTTSEKLAAHVAAMTAYVKSDAFAVTPYVGGSVTENNPLYAKEKTAVQTVKSDLNACVKSELALAAMPEGDKTAIQALAAVTREYLVRYQKLKERDGVLDFHDLEALAIKVLCDDGARAEVRERYEYVFVDEYQDINPTQEFILAQVSKGDNLFMVGDLKQSIYGFRLCDPDIFARKYAAMHPVGTVDLNCNYRSASGVLKFCNDVFSRLMTDAFGGVDYGARARFSYPKEADGDDACVKLCLIKKQPTPPAVTDGVYSVEQDDERSDASDAYREGLVIAAEIAKVVLTQQAAYRDFAVLMRSMAGADELVRALEESGVPVTVQTECDMLSFPAVAAVCDFLRLLVCPDRDYPLVSVMLSSLFSFTEDELATFRLCALEGGAAPRFFYESVRYCLAAAKEAKQRETASALDEKLLAFFATVAEFRAYAGYMMPSEIVAKLAARTGYERAVAAEGEDAFKVYIRFTQELRASRYNTDAVAFVGYLDGLEGGMTVKLTSPAQDAVTVMTMHKSKGLEYPYVFLARLGKQFNPQSMKEEVLVTRKFGVAMYDYDESVRQKSENRRIKLSKRDIKRREREEELRIFYVAATRAKRQLWCVGTAALDKPRKDASPETVREANSMLAWLIMAVQSDIAHATLPYEGEKERFESVYALEVFESGETAVHPAPPSESAADAACVEMLRQSLSYEYPHALRVPAKTSVTAVSARAEAAPIVGWVTDDTDAREIRESGEDATVRGNAYHHAMEHMSLSVMNEGQTSSALDILMRDGKLSEAERTLIDDRKIFEAVRALHAIGAEKILREQRFTMLCAASLVGGDASDRVLVQGVIDALCVFADGSAAVVDYKTTRRTDAAYLAAAYGGQLALYAEAAEACGYRIRFAAVYAFERGEMVRIDSALTTGA